MSETKKEPKSVFIPAKFRVFLSVVALWVVCMFWNAMSTPLCWAAVITLIVLAVWTITQFARENP